MKTIIKTDDFYSEINQKYRNLDYTSNAKKTKNARDFCREYLMEIQKGLCAYTEITMGESNDIEHYNPELKKNDGFEPDNIFLAFSGLNRLKRSSVPQILRPDNKNKRNLSPEELLDYDSSSHEYFAKLDLDEELQKIIEKDIKTLRLNAVPTKQARQNKIDKFIICLKTRQRNKVDLTEPHFEDFPTALKLCIKNLGISTC